MKLTEFNVYTTLAGTELLAGCFIELGFDEYIVYEGRDSVEEFLNDSAENWDYADIDKIAPGDTPCISTYIPDVPENVGKVEKLKNAILAFAEENPYIDLAPLNIEINVIEEQDWANNWKQYYKPTPIGERLMVCPSWEKVEDLGDRKLLLLDPGMAFGSGLHETTRMCLEQIEKTVHNGKTLIDLGCGSGILSIAASLLGAENLKAVDVDPVCTRVSQENAELNGVKLDIAVGNVTDDEFFDTLLTNGENSKYDIVVANIVSGILIKIAYRVPQLMKKGGIFISSGILNERLEEVATAYEKEGIRVLEKHTMGEWSCIVATVD